MHLQTRTFHKQLHGVAVHAPRLCMPKRKLVANARILAPKTLSMAIINPALIKIAYRIALRAIPGRLIVLQLVKKGAFRLSWPWTVLLIVYSLFVTLIAASKSLIVKNKTSETIQNNSVHEVNSSEVMPRPGKVSELEEECHVCNGMGTVAWEGKFTYEDGYPCPCCLGLGRKSKTRRFVWS